MKLYNYWRSSSSWRVRIALHHKGLPFEYVPVHLLKDGGQQNTEEYRKINPGRTVPLLEVEEVAAGVVIVTSTVLLLPAGAVAAEDDLHGGTRRLPSGARRLQIERAGMLARSQRSRYPQAAQRRGLV